jgi:S-DNA-T family DNA segregation ATPase FtsK/SpoIIIE
MAKKDKKKQKFSPLQTAGTELSNLHPDTKKSIWSVLLIGIAVLLALAGFGKAGPGGQLLFLFLRNLLGVGYFILPLAFLFVAGILLFSDRHRVLTVTLLGTGLMVLSILGIVELVFPGEGGWLGSILGSFQYAFGKTAAIVLNVIILAVAVLVALNIPLSFKKLEEEMEEEAEPQIASGTPDAPTEEDTAPPKPEQEVPAKILPLKGKAFQIKNYVPPPLSLLQSGTEKPTTGDLRANANIIKRTLESFGISVEMGEISIGPKVTRYTLKPAEGVKLSRITALGQDLSLALAAHPIRIEAPIPGKSLVGIEVPNKTAALVRLGSLMGYGEFASSGPLGLAMGRDVTGEPVFANIEKMPHMLIAGATGSGKSVSIHSLIVSLLYKNSPATLRLILVDPKRVELSVYEGLPHLVSPVITENKKAIGVFRWAISEMERRYELLLQSGSRDVKSYNAKHEKDPLPYLLLVVDELADLMTSYGRDVEGSIIRLAQMARATGIHLVLATQRPSVEVITGLIKANITTRVAFQVASQIDSRTILDTGGAEKLLGGGDLLFVSAELSKPRRVQGTYITEDEIRSVAEFIKEKNPKSEEAEEAPSFSGQTGSENGTNPNFDDYLDGDGDELYEEALRVVTEAQKASASLLQRRLKVGYARAARLLDLMEEKGVVGPGEGAKPREVFVSAPTGEIPAEMEEEQF